jgi:hypothetical protein
VGKNLLELSFVTGHWALGSEVEWRSVQVGAKLAVSPNAVDLRIYINKLLKSGSRDHYSYLRNRILTVRNESLTLKNHPLYLRNHCQGLKSHRWVLKNHYQALKNHPWGVKNHYQGLKNHCFNSRIHFLGLECRFLALEYDFLGLECRFLALEYDFLGLECSSVLLKFRHFLKKPILWAFWVFFLFIDIGFKMQTVKPISAVL